MCIVCVLLDKDKITRSEAKKALWEQVSVDELSDEDYEHIQKVYGKLDKEEKESKQ